MTGIRLENVAKSFGKTPALRDVSVDIRDGEFMVLLGPSGCGKTTLLRTVGGPDRCLARRCRKESSRGV